MPAAAPASPRPVPGDVTDPLAWRRRVFLRHVSLIAAGAGVAVFIAAGLTQPVAGADSAGSASQPRVEYFTDQLTLVPPRAPELASLGVTSHSKTKPKKAKPAPADSAAISSLAANGIPRVALNAYRVAAARMASVAPSCGIDWSLIAGIGRVESDHGRFAGAVLHTDGISTPRIIGPALDGKHWDYIPAPANGLELAGDAMYAHALGPMQFIPSTWAIYGADATGDRKADVFNVNDAALGTARYLCAAGGNLRTQPGRIRAVLAYNHNTTYLAQVLALADAYHRGLRVTGIPIVGITKGGLPTIVDTGYVPPANPGDPTAVSGKGGSTSGGKTGGKSGGSSSSSTPTKSASTPKPSTSTSSKPSSSSAAPSSPTPSSSSPSCGPLRELLHQC